MVGLASARALARAGHEVEVYEQGEVGHALGSSHGRSRIFRLAYAEPGWVRLAQEALAGWRELEAETGEELLEQHGFVELVRDLDESSAAALGACGVAWDELAPAEAEGRFPIRVPPGRRVVLQPEAGVLRADRALAALARGLRVHEGVRVEAPDELDADVVVLAAGPWLSRLLDRPLGATVTRETVCYFRLAGKRPPPALV